MGLVDSGKFPRDPHAARIDYIPFPKLAIPSRSCRITCKDNALFALQFLVRYLAAVCVDQRAFDTFPAPNQEICPKRNAYGVNITRHPEY